MGASTQELFTRFRAGDPGSFEDLYRRVAPRLWLWAGLRVPMGLRAQIDPEDLVQEVWMRAHRHRERFDPELGPFRSWLLGIASNVLREQLRRLARRSRPGQRSLDSEVVGSDEFPAEMTSVTQAVARDEELAVLRRTVEKLDPQSQRLFVFRGLEELPWHEVAERMQISVDAAEMRWRRLKTELRLRLLRPGILADN